MVKNKEICIHCKLEIWDNTGIGMRSGINLTYKEFSEEYCNCEKNADTKGTN